MQQATVALVRSEMRYRRLFEAARDGILILNSDTGSILDVNPFLIELLGYSHEEYLGKALWEIGPFRDTALSRARFEELQATGYIRYDDLPLRAKNGRHVDAEFVSNIYNESGNDIIQCNVRDITECKKLNNDLVKSEDKFRSMFESMRDGMFLVDLDTGKFEDVNNAGCVIYGYTREELIGRDIEALSTGVPPYTRDGVIERLEKARSGIPQRFDWHCKASDGHFLWAGISLSSMSFGDRPVGLAVTRDITGRMQGERALRTLSAANEAVVHATAEAELYAEMCRIAVEIGGYAGAWIGLADHDGTTTIRPVAWAGNDIAAYLESAQITWLDAERGRGPTGTASRTGRVQVNQSFSMTPGVALWRTAALERGFVASAALPLNEVTGAPFGVLTIYAAETNAFNAVELDRLKDLAAALSFGVTTLREHGARERTEAQLRQAQKMEAIGNLTGGMAHDFNNLLGVIIGNLDLARERLGGNKELSELLGEAHEAAWRGADLTRRLLAFARRSTLVPASIKVNDLITNTMTLMRRLLGEDIEIALDLGEQTWPVTADPAQLESALANLATNARDAMPRGGHLVIRTSNARLDADYAETHIEVTPGDYTLIEVSDTGVGMAPETVAHIFEPFFTTKDPGKGTGLGLSMVFGFMRQSGGHVSVYSEEGAGTTFRLYLPRRYDDAAAGAASDDPLAAAHGAGECVLVVEDQLAMRRIAVRQLRDLGYRVVEAARADAALELLGREPVDLLLTDIVMPGGIDGVELARVALERWPALKIVLTSGFPDVRTKHDKAFLEKFQLLSKPYSKNDLAQVLRDALDAKPVQ